MIGGNGDSGRDGIGSFRHGGGGKGIAGIGGFGYEGRGERGGISDDGADERVDLWLGIGVSKGEGEEDGDEGCGGEVVGSHFDGVACKAGFEVVLVAGVGFWVFLRGECERRLRMRMR